MTMKTSSATRMTAADRRAFLQKVTAALGFMPVAGCIDLPWDELEVGPGSARRLATKDSDTLLESAWALIILIAAITIAEFLKTPGSLFLYAMGAYGAGRIALEATRQEQDLVFGLAVNRIFSAALVLGSLIGLSAAGWR